MHSRHWIKVVIILVVVMGIAWIGNLLFFDVKLIFVAYIMTIFIAGQGIIIFILFVPLSKQVMNMLYSSYSALYNNFRLERPTNFGGENNKNHQF